MDERLALPRLRIPGGISEGDRLPDLSVKFRTSTWDGGTLTLTLEQPGGAVVEKTATVTSGAVSISWADGDFVDGLGQICTIRVAASAGHPKVTLTKFYVDVMPAPPVAP